MKALEEERRLAYVGLTRARRRAIVQPCRQPAHLRQLAEQHPQPLHRGTAGRRCRAHRFGGAGARCADAGGDDVHRPVPAGGAPARRTIEAWEQPARPARADAIPVGARVFHQKFGYGTVTAAEDDRLDVAFDKAGDKRVLDRFVEKA